MRILCFVTVLGGGGAERQVVRVLNGLDRERFQSAVAVLRPGGSYEPELRKDVPIFDLRCTRIRAAIPPLRRLIRDERPDVLCAFMDRPNCVALAATYGLRRGPAVVACLQVAPSADIGSPGSLRHRGLVYAASRLYPRADRLIAISDGVGQDIVRLVPAVRARTVVIPNAGPGDEVRDLACEPFPMPRSGRRGKVVVACGRLTEQKGFDVLLEAVANVSSTEDVSLWLVGDGELRGVLERRANELRIGQRVWFTGFRSNPYPLIAAGDVFVLSSLWEGFGNVIVEAMALGIPVIATDCPYGPGEIIQHEKNGLLVPPSAPEMLADAIRRVLRDDPLRKTLAQQGRARSRDFRPTAIAERYGRVFEQVASADRGRS